MSFAPEPAFSHGTAAKTAVLICNLGTPDEPTPKAVRRYLAEFLSDPRVVEIPRLLWWPILHGIVLRIRPAKSARKYARIWMKEGSPLKVWTEKQALLLAGYLGQRGQPVLVAPRDALRPAFDRRRARCASCRRRRAGAGAAALSAVRRGDDGERRRRGRRLDEAPRATCPSCASSSTSTTTRATSAPWRAASTTTG